MPDETPTRQEHKSSATDSNSEQGVASSLINVIATMNQGNDQEYYNFVFKKLNRALGNSISAGTNHLLDCCLEMLAAITDGHVAHTTPPEGSDRPSSSVSRELDHRLASLTVEAFRFSLVVPARYPLGKRKRARLIAHFGEKLAQTIRNKGLLVEQVEAFGAQLLARCRILAAGNEDLQSRVYEHFYSYLCFFIRAGAHQRARDLAEETMIAARRDGLLEWGATLSGLVNIQQNHFVPGLLYSLSALELITTKGRTSDRCWFVLLQNIQMASRHLRPRIAQQLKDRLLSIPCLDTKETLMANKVYFDSILRAGNWDALNEQLPPFLKAHVAKISEDKEDLLIWLCLLLNCELHRSEPLRQHYETLSRVDFSVTADAHRRLGKLPRDRLTEDLENRIKLHSETRDNSDLAAEVQQTAVVARDLLKLAYDEGNLDSYLKAFSVLHDLTIGRRAIAAVGMRRAFSPLRSSSANQPSEKIFKNGGCLLRLAEAGQKILGMQTSLNIDNGSSFFQWPEANERIKVLNVLVADLSDFDKLGKETGVRYRDNAEIQQQHLDKFIEHSQFLEVPEQGSATIIVLREPDLGRLPLNFLQLRNPSCRFCDGVGLTLIQTNRNRLRTQPRDSIFFWIPTDSGDMAINFVKHHLKDFLRAQKGIKVHTQVQLASPISARLCLVCAHGSEVSYHYEEFFAGGHQINATDTWLGRAEVVVLLVCLGGRSQKGYFRHRQVSIFRTLLEHGVKAVIAPVWVLDTESAAVWVQAFHRALTLDGRVFDACHSANESLRKVNRNPCAWLAMHYFGDPEVTLDLASVTETA